MTAVRDLLVIRLQQPPGVLGQSCVHPDKKKKNLGDQCKRETPIL